MSSPQSSAPQRACTRSQLNEALPRLLFTVLCTSHTHRCSSALPPVAGGLLLHAAGGCDACKHAHRRCATRHRPYRTISWKCCAHSAHGYTLVSVSTCAQSTTCGWRRCMYFVTHVGHCIRVRDTPARPRPSFAACWASQDTARRACAAAARSTGPGLHVSQDQEALSSVAASQRQRCLLTELAEGRAVRCCCPCWSACHQTEEVQRCHRCPACHAFSPRLGETAAGCPLRPAGRTGPPWLWPPGLRKQQLDLAGHAWAYWRWSVFTFE